MNILPDIYFKTIFGVAESYGSLLQLLLEHGDFFEHRYFTRIDISQCVATHLRCGGIFKYKFVANLPMSLPAKEF